MEDKILEIISKENGKITFKEILKKYNTSKYDLERLLLKLKLDGKVLQLGNKYRLFPNDLVIGTVLVSSSGNKYIIHNGEKILIASDFFDGLLLNDVVAFKLDENNQAQIISIVDRKLGKMTCEVKEINGKLAIIPFHDGIDVRLDNNIMGTLMSGDIIIVNITENETSFVRKLGRCDDPLIDDYAIALNYGFDNDYDDDFLHEINAYPTSVADEELSLREDYRDQASFTIDGAYTKDMDDGVYAEVLDNNIIRVYVHIADVSHYIKPNSKLFARACEKTTSLYMNNSVFHMLHYVISNGICSLNPNCDRLTKTVIMDIDSNGKIINYDIQKSVINSKKKMVYEDVDDMIMRDKMVTGYESFKKTLYILYDAALRLEKRFVLDNGKINFANTELSIKYNSDGTINSVSNPENSIARKIIENLMIAANSCVADWFINIDMPTVYRVHEFPNITKINATIELLNQNGFHIMPIKDIDNPKSLQKILSILSTYPEYPVISQMLVMAMQRARYSTENLGHYALGLPAYLHFTSPIRRLPDLLVHMMIDLILTNSDKITVEYLKYVEERLNELAKKSSAMERQAQMAEGIAERRSILKYLEKSKDSYFEGTVLELGKHVKVRVQGVDTYVDCHKFDKILSYDVKRKRYFDKATGQHLKIGSKLVVKITSISPVNDKFDIAILGFTKQDVKRRTLKK